MKRPAVIFDRDNTLIASDGYLGDPSKVTLVSGAADAIARARQLGYAIVVVSNQSGVARGMFSEEDVKAVNARMDELLAAENPAAVVDRHEFCPFHPDGTVDVYARESDRRKPKPGMILSAAEKLALDLSKSWVIGDAGRDIEAGKAAGCRTIRFTDASMKKSPAAQEQSKVDADYSVTTLAEAIAYIERNPEPGAAPQAPIPIRSASQAAPAAASTAKIEMPSPVPSVSPAQPPVADDDPTPAAPAPRVPKVAIGSKYVPPAGRETAERPAPRRTATIAETDTPRAAAPPAAGTERMESLLEQICLELRRQHEHHEGDFSVSKLLAGVVQVIVLAILFLSYLKRGDNSLQTYLSLALILQTMTISLLIMSRQK
ncbi:MAG: gmhB [Phycisphaerales bacterium]|nr:gmhB [Phycisphaerales bacterium]